VAVGVTVIDVPVPWDVPEEHEPEYHFQLALVPNEPPLKVNLDVFPGQTAVTEAVADAATEDDVSNVTTTSSVDGAQGEFDIVHRNV
jgi:hypothetical protein